MIHREDAVPYHKEVASGCEDRCCTFRGAGQRAFFSLCGTEWNETDRIGPERNGSSISWDTAMVDDAA